MPGFRTAALREAAIYTGERCELPVTFAAEELQRYVRVLTGMRLPIQSSTALPDGTALAVAPQQAAGERIALSPPPLRGPDAFAIVADAQRVTLASASARGALAAVYALLEQLGCRWSLHGAGEEHVPRLSASTIELEPVAGTFGCAVRGYSTDIMTWHYTQPEYFTERLADDRAFIDWMGKSGANAFFFIRHPFDTQLTITELLPEFRRRGIDVEYGGHVIPLLLPREQYRDHPEYFPAAPDGTRTDHGNLCTSNAEALATASHNAVRYVRDYPEMSVLHIWGADLWQGGWCRCAACRTITVQDQSLRVCNAVARSLVDAGAARPVCYLAYHDTIDARLTQPPDDNVFVEFAPRERCYGHALNDPGCVTNRGYAAALERYVEHFAGRVRIFEYYADAILWCGCAVPLTQVIAADWDYYQRLGVAGITMLQFGTFSLWAYPLNFLTFAAMLRVPCPPDRVGRGSRLDVGTEYAARFGSRAPAAAALLADLERVMQQVVTYGDIRRPPRKLDSAAPLLPCIEAALPKLGDVADRLERLGGDGLAAQAVLVRYTLLVLEGVRQELRGVIGEAGHSTEMRARDAAAARGLYDRAVQTMETVERRFKGLWGSVDLPMIHAFFSAGRVAAEPEPFQ
ncbi:MAG: DUF4838 domain-containing protein [Acidobacteriia bacterium]|nr:DUF4838 domain-containing protein [Terriglobia bacterium]